MAESTLNIQNTEELSEDAKEVLKQCEEIRHCIEELRKEKEALSEWQSDEKNRAFASLDQMNAKLEELVQMAESYGAVGIQTAAATEAAEADVKAMNNKLANYIN